MCKKVFRQHYIDAENKRSAESPDQPPDHVLDAAMVRLQDSGSNKSFYGGFPLGEVFVMWMINAEVI